METGGGGGWGHPYDREPERVLNDVLAGFVSPANALAEYGVVLTADGKQVDEAATGQRRADRPETQLFHRGAYTGALD